ncbi:MAG TPA: hypothetical protein VNK51_06585 [Bradyrhizobium sp.]|nr:hypothetical protein [Bradyrhizobium sp.]
MVTAAEICGISAVERFRFVELAGRLIDALALTPKTPDPGFAARERPLRAVEQRKCREMGQALVEDQGGLHAAVSEENVAARARSSFGRALPVSGVRTWCRIMSRCSISAVVRLNFHPQAKTNQRLA